MAEAGAGAGAREGVIFFIVWLIQIITWILTDGVKECVGGGNLL